MKFNFKIQKYQTDAVDAVIKAFAGQGFHDHTRFIRDLGEMSANDKQMQLGFTDNNIEVYDPSDDTGYKNGFNCLKYPILPCCYGKWQKNTIMTTNVSCFVKDILLI